MKANTLRILCFCLCVAAVQGVRAQAPPPGGPGGPGGAPRPGMPGSPGAPGSRGERPSPNASHQSNPGTGNAATPRNALQFGPVGRWWDDKSVVANLGLSRQQQKKMDAVFDANRPAIVNSYKAFLKAQAHLDAVNQATHPDQAQVFAAIDAVNQARSELQKAASAMLRKIREQMNPDQIDKLEKLQ